MKKNYDALFIVYLPLLIVFVVLLSSQLNFFFSKESKMAYSRLARGANLVKKILKSLDVGVEMSNGPIRSLGLSFQADKILSKDKLRRTVINAHNDFLNFGYNDKETQPFILNLIYGK